MCNQAAVEKLREQDAAAIDDATVAAGLTGSGDCLEDSGPVDHKPSHVSSKPRPWASPLESTA